MQKFNVLMQILNFEIINPDDSRKKERKTERKSKRENFICNNYFYSADIQE